MPPGRPAGSGEAQRARILDVVAPLIAERGAARVRLGDVAERAAVSVGMIQHYFGTRERLIDEAFRSYSLSVVAELRAATADRRDPWRNLRALCTVAVGARNVRQRSVIWFDFVGQASRDPARRRIVRQVHTAWVDAFVAVIEDGTERGVFTPVVAPIGGRGPQLGDHA